MDLQFGGKKALVCGASQGIGKAIAKQLAGLGCVTYLAARNTEKLNQVVEEFGPSGHRAFAVDFLDLEQVQKLGETVVELGGVDILICNSGGPKGGPLLEAPHSALESAFRQHLTANQILVQKLVPGMREKGYGRIITILSTSVKAPIPNLGVSNTIRGAVASWSKTLAGELGPVGITVNNILPGFTATARLDTLKSATAQRLKKTEAEVEELWKSSIPAGRMGQPEEVAAAATFLASPAASYLNGINLPVDGGRTPSL